MANGLTSLFNFSSNEEALREGARRRMELQSRAAGRNVASVSAQSATNPAAIARNVNEAQAVERSRVGAEYQSALMQAQQADQQRAGQFVGSLLGTAGSILGTVIPGAQIGGKLAEKAVGGITQAATSNAEFPAGAPGRVVMPNPQGQQAPSQALGNPVQPAPSMITPHTDFNQAQNFLTAPPYVPGPQNAPMNYQAPMTQPWPNGTTTPPRQPQASPQAQPQQAPAQPQQAVSAPSPTPTLPAPAAMAGVSPAIQGATPPPPVQGPTAPVGQLQERSRLQEDDASMNVLQQLFQLQRR